MTQVEPAMSHHDFDHFNDFEYFEHEQEDHPEHPEMDDQDYTYTSEQLLSCNVQAAAAVVSPGIEHYHMLPNAMFTPNGLKVGRGARQPAALAVPDMWSASEPSSEPVDQDSISCEDNQSLHDKWINIMNMTVCENPTHEIEQSVSAMRHEMEKLYGLSYTKITAYLSHNTADMDVQEAPAVQTTRISRMMVRPVHREAVPRAKPVAAVVEPRVDAAAVYMVPADMPRIAYSPSADSDHESESEPEDEPVVHVESVCAPTARFDTHIRGLKTRQQIKIERALLLKQNRVVVEPSPRSKSKRGQKLQDRKNNMELTRMLLSGPPLADEVTSKKRMLCDVYNPIVIMSIYAKMLLMAYKTMFIMMNDPSVMIDIPPINTDPRMMIASPLKCNVVHTPLVPVSLCVHGMSCEWFRYQAQLQLGVKLLAVPNKPCLYLHYSKHPLVITTAIDGVTRDHNCIQCSVSNCTSARHYTPPGTYTVVHITPSLEKCMPQALHPAEPSKLLFCVHALSREGCPRVHVHRCNIIIAMIVRGVLYGKTSDPDLWPSSNRYMAGLFNHMLNIKVPASTDTEFNTIGKIVKHNAQFWYQN